MLQHVLQNLPSRLTPNPMFGLIFIFMCIYEGVMIAMSTIFIFTTVKMPLCFMTLCLVYMFFAIFKIMALFIHAQVFHFFACFEQETRTVSLVRLYKLRNISTSMLPPEPMHKGSREFKCLEIKGRSTS